MKTKCWNWFFFAGLLVFITCALGCSSGNSGGTQGEDTKVHATSVKIIADVSEFKIGESVQLYASILPEDSTDSLVWSSSDSNIASVDSYGLVTGFSAGSVTITVKAGSVSDSITFNIKEKEKIEGRVLHYKQSLEDEDDYELFETETFSAEPDSVISSNDYINDYSGFSFNDSLSDLCIYYLSADNNELKLYYDRKTFTITFDTDGGSEIESVTGKTEETVTAPENPTKKHYIFDGWSPELPSTFTDNLSVKAQWKEIDKGDVGAEIY